MIGCGGVGVGDDLVRVWSKFMQGLGSQPKSEQQNFKFNLSFSFETVHEYSTQNSFLICINSLAPKPPSCSNQLFYSPRRRTAACRAVQMDPVDVPDEEDFSTRS